MAGVTCEDGLAVVTGGSTGGSTDIGTTTVGVHLGAGGRVGEDLGEPVAARLEPQQPQAEVGGAVPDRVEHRVVVVAHVEHGVP